MIFKSVVKKFYAIVVGSVFLLACLGGTPAHAILISESDVGSTIDNFGNVFADRYILPAGTDVVTGSVDVDKSADTADFFSFAGFMPGSTFFIEAGKVPGSVSVTAGPTFYDDFGVEIDLVAESWSYVDNLDFESSAKFTINGFITAGGFINISMPPPLKDRSSYMVTLVSATAVPLPATLWLLVSGLTGLIAASRRRVCV